MLQHLIRFFNQRAYVYYFDLSFEETVKRHNTREKKMEFGEDVLRQWWTPQDYLGVENETIFTDELSQDEVLQIIFNQVNSEEQ